MRDLSLVSVMMLLALWSGSQRIGALVGCALLSMVVGLADWARPCSRWYLVLIFLPGLFFALSGQLVSYVSVGRGAFFYFSWWQSVVLTSVWMWLFPVLFRRLDGVPGLAGHLLAVSLGLMAFVSFFSRQDLGEAFLVSAVSLVLVGAFWSRLGHEFRQLGAPLASLWGTLVAGISIIGVSKGIALGALMVIPLGFYAVPLVELSLGLVCQALYGGRARGRSNLYGRVVERGVDHPAAVRLVTEVCFVVGASVALLEFLPDSVALRLVVPAAAGVSLLVLWGLLGGRRRSEVCHSLWGVRIDGVSMNLALSRCLAWLRAPVPRFRMVVTLNALGAFAARGDGNFRAVLSRSDLTLPDGAGLVWAMRWLRLAVVERVAGIDFMDRLCRLAAAEGLGVFLLGGRPCVARAAARFLEVRHPGLVVAGVFDGYFDRGFSSEVARGVRESGARVLFVAMGMPQQERWIDAMRGELDGVLCVGVGGSFDVFAGRVARAPGIWQRLGLEWLYRLLREPWRLGRDLGLVGFVLAVLRERVGFFPWKGK